MHCTKKDALELHYFRRKDKRNYPFLRIFIYSLTNNYTLPNNYDYLDLFPLKLENAEISSYHHDYQFDFFVFKTVFNFSKERVS